MWFDADFSFSEHVDKACKACFLKMCDLFRIRWYLTQEVAVLVANTFVSSSLDYCKFLFKGLLCFNQNKLQSFQNILTHMVTNNRKYDHVAPILKQLHWLPVTHHCMFKTTILVNKFLHSGSPSYFKPHVSLSSCSYSTRRSHSDYQYLTVPPFHYSFYK